MASPRQLAPAEVAVRLRQRQPIIMAGWERLLRDRHPEIDPASESPLRDALPHFLLVLADVLAGTEAPRALEKIACEHGEQRTQMPEYTLEQLFTEYRLLRRMVFEALESPWEEPDPKAMQCIVTALEEGMQAACVSFFDILLRRERLAVEAREEVLNLVSHDVRDPLQTVVSGMALLLETVDDPQARESLQRMNRAAKVAAGRVNALVDAAQIDAGGLAILSSVEPVDELLLQIRERHAAVAEERDVTLQVEASTDACVLADAEQLARVFDNLISNALRFTAPSGTIVVAADLDGEAGDVVRFDVSDDGPGIRPDHLPRVFERFWRAPRNGDEDGNGNGNGNGAGLGLAIARGIVRAHGGEIWVESEPGNGATFHFTVPRAEPTHVSGKALPRPSPGH